MNRLFVLVARLMINFFSKEACVLHKNVYSLNERHADNFNDRPNYLTL
jgi:hypothetical protein